MSGLVLRCFHAFAFCLAQRGCLPQKNIVIDTAHALLLRDFSSIISPILPHWAIVGALTYAARGYTGRHRDVREVRCMYAGMYTGGEYRVGVHGYT